MSGKALSEQTTRQRLMKYAKLIGAQEDLEQLFKKWDAIIPLASLGERESMAYLAILEIERLLDIYSAQNNGLTIGGKIVIPAAEKKEPV
jgi:hypothetical protein